MDYSWRKNIVSSSFSTHIFSWTLIHYIYRIVNHDPRSHGFLEKYNWLLRFILRILLLNTKVANEAPVIALPSRACDSCYRPLPTKSHCQPKDVPWQEKTSTFPAQPGDRKGVLSPLRLYHVTKASTKEGPWILNFTFYGSYAVTLIDPIKFLQNNSL